MTSAKKTPALPAVPEKIDMDGLRGQLDNLGLVFAAEQLSTRLADATKNKLGMVGFLKSMLDDELEQREERRIRTALKLSSLPTGQTMSNFDFTYQPSVERSLIEWLGTGEWIRNKEALMIFGPPGVGKTHLAVALGVRAVECGFSVLFRRLDELLYELRRDASIAPSRLRRKGYMKTGMLVIDEMGFQPLTKDEANLFFRLVNYRYGRGSICITSNKGIKEWPEMFAGDEVLTTALLDRLLHRCQVLNISGRSYRLKDLENRFRGID